MTLGCLEFPPLDYSLWRWAKETGGKWIGYDLAALNLFRSYISYNIIIYVAIVVRMPENVLKDINAPALAITMLLGGGDQIPSPDTLLGPPAGEVGHFLQIFFLVMESFCLLFFRYCFQEQQIGTLLQAAGLVFDAISVSA